MGGGDALITNHRIEASSTALSFLHVVLAPRRHGDAVLTILPHVKPRGLTTVSVQISHLHGQRKGRP